MGSTVMRRAKLCATTKTSRRQERPDPKSRSFWGLLLSNTTGITRRLVAVFAADVEGYSRLMGADEVGTLKGLTERRAILDRAIGDHRGRIANTAGDSVLAEFGSAVDAVQCAVEAQVALAEANSSLPPDKRINFRIGVHVGDVMVRAGDLFGDGVNIAARLQTLAQPGSVCVSGTTYEHVKKVVPVAFTDLGAQQVKNIEEPVRAYTATTTSTFRAQPTASEQLPLPDKPSIAVLPFQNMSGDPEQEYFADGMVEDIITALSRFKSLFVIARNSSFTYKGKAVDIKQVGRELGVRYVLEGSVRNAGGRVRITGQLIDATTGAHLWVDKYDGALEDVFELQDSVTASVVGAIVPQLDQASKDALKRKPPENWDSYDHYLRGRMLLSQRTLEGTNEAQTEFRKAIEIDPNFGLGYAFAAYSCFVRRNVRRLPVTDQERAEALRMAERGTELASDDDAALIAAWFVVFNFTDDFERTAALADRAIALNPNAALAWIARGWSSTFLEKPEEEALDAFARAIRLNPLDREWIRYAWFGNSTVCYFAGRYKEGAAWAKQMLAQRPTDLVGLAMLECNAHDAGDLAEAKIVADRMRATYPDLRAAHLRAVFSRGPKSSACGACKQEHRSRRPSRMTLTRRLAAILAADVAGYSRLMGADEVGTLEALKAHRREVVDPAIAANHGRVVKTTGDGMLAEFASAVDAVTCAMSVQEQMAERNANGSEPRIQFRIGINIGDIISEGDDIFGDGVNVAARVENECEPGGVYLSGSAHEQITGKTTFAFEELGERTLKNITRPVRLYAARLASRKHRTRRGAHGWRAAAASRQTFHCRAAIPEHERRSRAGVLR